MMPTIAPAVHLPGGWFIQSHNHDNGKHKRKLMIANADSRIRIVNIYRGSRLPQTHNCCCKGKERDIGRDGYNSTSNQSRKYSIFRQRFRGIDTKDMVNHNPDNGNNDQRRVEDEERELKGDKEVKEVRVLFTNMWWVDMKAAFGQRINLEGILFSTLEIFSDPKLALPHISVPDIRYIDWAELHRRGFKGVVFDKDNTITVPYSLTPWPPLESSLDRCKLEFGPRVAVFSNSAGLREYDHDDSKARMLENAIGIKVIRHRVKKPAGTAEEIEKHFGCKSSQLIMVGDRPFTDIVYGNRNGFLTILTEPFSPAEEPFIVKQVRKLETSFVTYWSGKGLKPLDQKLLPNPMACVKEPHR
ncbi:hypothetical protein TanjilG_27631 [Lupinus angustifolius]|uniref:Uncharacterized protein n=1 Tax=Lupinus angustifolius TaxID=3871 RepID=A0A1J7HUS2_LUPAN|nr:PREDICTED: uncharacterized protein LOC109357348 [Lupinus angustifolius]OIW05501.1 hypothetical protein TanjilG_27631 [Lupinus angustifolius]